jgi:predicted component of viral defense system (DUF524 family)
MPAESHEREYVECKTPQGRVLATVEIVAPAGSERLAGEAHPLVLLPVSEAILNNEERLQLRERGRYEYRLKPAQGAPTELALLAQRGVQPSRVWTSGEDRGLIEPQDHCGLLVLTVIRRGDLAQQPLARGSVEVRSLKLGYRDHYRGMLTAIAEQCAGLLMDSRAPTRLRLDTLWQQNARFLEQQLEFLRHTLESTAFRAAVDEVLRHPHRRLEAEREQREISRPLKPGKDFAQQVAIAARRVPVPPTHPLHKKIKSLPARISIQARTDFLDTAENRFAKLVLTEFRDFLADVAAHLARKAARTDTPETQRLLREAGRLRGALDTQLARGFFPDVSPPSVLPLGSPVLQRKAGYRELLRFWLQFHAGAQLTWDGGADVYAAGARNVAMLYEYWLFFQLEALFRQRFACDQPLHAIVVDTSKVPAQLVLKRGVELKTPVAGVWSQTVGRQMRAEFHFNQKFTPHTERDKVGSWTRGVQPDYTISIWPAEYSKQAAEQNELMVHVHFDAKYRVERVGELLGDKVDDDAFTSTTEAKGEAHSAAKYTDLLKMHAYRDAIRRTAGAYVLYPGDPGDGKQFLGFHEILPGLGAFAIRPDQDGKPGGINDLAAFLDTVIEHLANRTTARERVSYHISESYQVKEAPVPYGAHQLPEADVYGSEYRALPPAEDMVLVAWFNNQAQLALAHDNEGFLYVRLGRRQGALLVHPNLARVRHIILRERGGIVAPGLLDLREVGFRIFTRSALRAELQQHAQGSGVAAWEASAGLDEDENIYALFRTKSALEWVGQEWRGDILMDLIEQFEIDRRNHLVENLGRTSPNPRILPLRSVLMCLKDI